RVLSRLLLLRGHKPRGQKPAKRAWDAVRAAALWAAAAALVNAASDPGDLNQALMELGAMVCTPVAPACGACPVARFCAARAAGVQELIPGKRRLPRPVPLRQTVALVRRDGKILLRRRGRTGLMDGLWELPTVD